MAINYEKFLDWAESHFGDVIQKGDEIMINSMFCEEHGFKPDYKHHLSCNPSGGKLALPNGVYHCWKTNEGGSLVSLVMKVDKCQYDEALERLGGTDVELHALEQKVAEMFFNKTIAEETPNKLQLPENTRRIIDLPVNDFWRIEAEVYLQNRKLDPKDYMVCTGGQFKNRIVIPYYDIQGKLIYWNARFLTDSKKVPKYLGPHKDCGVGKGDVVYMPENWPPANSKLHITEGEFDAKSIALSGLYACAVGGKELSDKQASMLLTYKPVLCFDADQAGGRALLNIGDGLKKKGFHPYFVRPPKQYKDWNQMFIKLGPKIISNYIKENTKEYDSIEYKLDNS